jgi:hypothetical protein
MNYPHAFPDRLKPSVDIAFAESEREFARSYRTAMSRDDGEPLVKAFVRRVYVAFAHAVCKAISDGEQGWDAERFRRESDPWFWDLFRTTYSRKAGWSYRAGDDDFRSWQKLKSEIETSNDWIAIQSELDAAIKHSAAEKFGAVSGSRIVTPIDRMALWKDYRRLFPRVKVLDVCWAAAQHYSEWKRWLRGPAVVKDGSRPDMAFRAILASAKSPSEYRKQPRPSGWK